MKRKLLLVLSVILVLSLCVGCGQPAAETAEPAPEPAAPAQEPAGEPEPAAEPAPDLGSFSFTLSSHDPATSEIMLYKQRWADAIKEATGGNVEITIYGTGTIAAAGDVVDVVKAGGADLGWVMTGFFPGQYQLTEVLGLPMQGFGDNRASTETLWDLYEEYPAVSDEWSDFKLLMVYANPGNTFGTSTRPVAKVSDLAGLNMRCPAGPITSVMSAWGGNPIGMPPGDIYQSLERNNIDGWVWETAGAVSFSVPEVTNYYTKMEMYNMVFALVMNKQAWDSLPAEYQEIIDGMSGREASVGAAQAFYDAVIRANGIITDMGGEFIDVTPEDQAEFKIEADKFAATWADGVTADLDAQAYLAKANEQVAKYNAQYAG
ncbi:MAG: TRAP transporter substrate-binding protein [Clostridiales bacterium]|nr:TRAP transporter substrate-binding protein [Clostridiales bacterium]